MQQRQRRSGEVCSSGVQEAAAAAAEGPLCSSAGCRCAVQQQQGPLCSAAAAATATGSCARDRVRAEQPSQPERAHALEAEGRQVEWARGG